MKYVVESSNACLKFGIRLKDYTGHWQSLGTLPQDDDYEDKSEDESGDERSDDDLRGSPLSKGNGRTMELTCLLEECRVMKEGCDEALIARICPTLTTDEFRVGLVFFM